MILLLSCKKNTVENQIVTFFIISDWGWNGNAEEDSVANQMENQFSKLKPKFIVTAGDNFQYLGVTSITDSLWKINYENVFSKNLLSIPWYATLGNHDYNGNVDAQIQYTSINKNWIMPSRYYTFTKNTINGSSIQFIVLDTQDFILKYNSLTDTSNAKNIKQIQWLKQTLTDSKCKWKIVIGHHPILSAGLHGNTKEMYTIIKPILEYYNVDFYICGHDHDFEHAQIQNKNTEYVVTGTGGNARSIKRNAQTIFCLSTNGFTNMSITDKSAEFDFINCDGQKVYSYIKSK